MPPTSRLPPDPFTTTATASASLRPQASQTSLRSNASSASTRTRQQGNLFAPTLSRRPTSRTRVEDDVLADSESDDRSITTQRQRPQMRKRHGSPKTISGRMKPRQLPEEQDIVNRTADGNYLPVTPGIGVPTAPHMFDAQGEDEQENTAEIDKHYAAAARHYFTSNAHHGGARQSSNKQVIDDSERDKHDIMLHMRRKVMQKLEDERWLYEPVDRMGV